MAKAVEQLSDVGVITSDNPRTEDPQAIIDEIKRGIPAGEAAGVGGRVPRHHGDRRPRRGNRAGGPGARAGDVVLVAGKGHEKTQHIGSPILAFDDAECRGPP